MLFAPPLKQASRHRELPDSLESLNPMFERHWRVIGERVEDADIWGAACHNVRWRGRFAWRQQADAGLALRHMTQLPLQRQNPADHEPGRLTIGGRQLESPFPAMQRAVL